MPGSEELFRAVADSTYDWEYWLGADGNYIYVSPSCERVTGYCADDFLNDPGLLVTITHPDDRAIVARHFREELESGEVFSIDFRIVTRNGEEHWIGHICQPVYGTDGRWLGRRASNRDITERKRAEEEQEKLIKDLDAFAHTVAHDLQNPLGLVVGYAEALGEDCAAMPHEELRARLHTIAQSGRRMSNIVDELLLLAEVRKVEEMEMRPLDMASIVVRAQERLACMIEKHQAEIILPAAWPTALGHAPWVEEVWVNYLSNAIKYGGQPPRIELGATIQPDDTVPLTVCFWVRDNGPGLTPEQQARLFTPFTRLDQVGTKGHGLGLSIVRRIVEKLGGQVEVESEVGRGSVFSFTLPGIAGQAR